MLRRVGGAGAHSRGYGMAQVLEKAASMLHNFSKCEGLQVRACVRVSACVCACVCACRACVRVGLFV